MTQNTVILSEVEGSPADWLSSLHCGRDDRLGGRDDRLGGRDDRLGGRDGRLGGRDGKLGGVRATAWRYGDKKLLIALLRLRIATNYLNKICAIFFQLTVTHAS
jgi:hypothetical protein